MDPITIVVGAFTALKSGINAGKELHSMGQDLAKLWHAIDDVDAEHNNAKKKAFRTVEEEAMETFLAKQKAKDLEDQLRQIIILTRGVAWAELVKMRADIRVKRQQERAKRIKEREELIEMIAIIGAVIVGAIVLFFILAFVLAPTKFKKLLNLAETLYSSFSFLA